MRSLLFRAVAALPLVVSLVFSSPVWAQTLTGVVVGVSDGDTLTLLDHDLVQHKVRLGGIDAPEKRQDFGQRAKLNLSAIAYGRTVVVEGGKMDRYGRLVGKVLVGGRDVNLRQIEAGLAWHYKAYQRDQSPPDRATYAAAESLARARRTGLWSMAQAVPPWEFRAAGRRLHTTGLSPRH